VMDRGSTNGTTVTAPDGGQRPCPPGDLIDVPPGSVISFGDHWLEVQRPGQGGDGSVPASPPGVAADGSPD
jgi:hypothetical protein